jgi:hypothetical protein
MLLLLPCNASAHTHCRLLLLALLPACAAPAGLLGVHYCCSGAGQLPCSQARPLVLDLSRLLCLLLLLLRPFADGVAAGADDDLLLL